MQSLLRHNSLSSDLVANTSDSSAIRDQEGAQREDPSQEVSFRSGLQRVKKDGEKRAMKDKASQLNMEVERDRTQDRISDQLQQTRSRSTSPARSALCPVVNFF